MRTDPIEIPVDCSHSAMERLGHDHDAGFYRCKGCGQVVVVQSGLTLTIPAVQRQPQPGSPPPAPERARSGVDD